MYRLLIVEDDAVMRSALAQSLKTAGYQVETAENGWVALEKLKGHLFDLIISDIRMPGLDGITTIAKIKETLPQIKTILITGYADDEPIIRALNLGIDGILKKPFGMKDLLRIVSLKLEEVEIEKEKEKNLEEREKKYHIILSKLKDSIGKEKTEALLGDEISLFSSPVFDETNRLAGFMRLGQLAELRNEDEVAIQAYEEALGVFDGKAILKDEIQIRLALSNLFMRKGIEELALLHAEEANELARKEKILPLLIDSHHHCAKILLTEHPEKSAHHLEEAKKLLKGNESTEKCATLSFLSAALSVRSNQSQKAIQSISELFSVGKRHFLPSLFLANQEISFDLLILSLEKKIEMESSLWLLEELAPFLQAKLKSTMAEKPSLSDLLSPFIMLEDASTKHQLQVFTFGRLAMFLSQSPLTEKHWRSTKGRSLFLYLLHEHPRLVSEEHLLDTFWPKVDLEKGRHAFRTTLYFIRRTLSQKNKNRFIYHEKQKFGIQKEISFISDFFSFRTHHKQAKSDWEAKRYDRAAISLKEAEKLYKGTFLQGWSDGWILEARASYQEAYTWTLSSLANYMRLQKSWAECLAYAKKTLKIDLTLEEVHFFAMEALFQMGRRDEAIKQYQSCRESLKKELRVEPGRQIYELYKKLIKSEK